MPVSATGELLADRAAAAVHQQLRRRRVVLVGLTMAGTLMGLLMAVLTPTGYEATGRLQMFLRVAPSSRQGRLSKGGLEDQRELMLGRTFLEEVARRLSPEDRELLFSGRKVRPGKHAASLGAELTTDSLRGLRIEIDDRTQMMDITESSSDPQLSAAVVNAAISAAQDLGLRQRMERTARVSVVMSERLDALEADIEQAESRENEAEERMGRVSGESGRGPGVQSSNAAASSSNALMNRKALRRARQRGMLSTRMNGVLKDIEQNPDEMLMSLSQALDAATLVRRLAEVRAGAFRSLRAAGEDGTLESLARGQHREDVERLRTQQRALQTQVATLEQQMGPAQPTLVGAQAALAETGRQLAREDQRLVDDAGAEAREAGLREAELRDEVGRQKKISSAAALARLQDQLPELSLAVNEDLYAAQTELLRGAQVDAALKASGFYVIARPDVPRYRARPAFRGKLLFGFGFGGLAGMLVVLLLSVSEARTWIPGAAELATGLNLMGLLPRIRPRQRFTGTGHPSIADREPDLYGSALLNLAERVMRPEGEPAAPAVLVTSATPGEGSSTTATGLAMLLARSGRRVLLVDANLRRPQLHRSFGLGARRGLSQVLSGTMRLDDAVQRVDEIPGLEVLAAGPMLYGSLDSSAPGSMEKLLLAARNPGDGGYGCVVIDAPALVGSVEAVYLARLCDVLLLVARYGRIDLRSLRDASRQLRHAAPPVSGLVVNGLPSEGVER